MKIDIDFLSTTVHLFFCTTQKDQLCTPALNLLLIFDGRNTIITFRGTNLSVGHFAFSLELSRFLPIEERFMRQVRDFTSKAAALQRIFKITLGVKQRGATASHTHADAAGPTEFIK